MNFHNELWLKESAAFIKKKTWVARIFLQCPGKRTIWERSAWKLIKTEGNRALDQAYLIEHVSRFLVRQVFPFKKIRPLLR